MLFSAEDYELALEKDQVQERLLLRRGHKADGSALLGTPVEGGPASAVAVSQEHIICPADPVNTHAGSRQICVCQALWPQLRVEDFPMLGRAAASPDSFKCASAAVVENGRSFPGTPSMCTAQDSSAAEQAASLCRLRALDKPKSAQRGSQPLRTEWSVAALTPSGPVSTTPQEPAAQPMPAPGLPLHEVLGAAGKDEVVPAAGSSQYGGGASLAERSREGQQLAGPILQTEPHTNHAASTARVSRSSEKDPLPLPVAQHSRLQKERSNASCGREQGPPEQDVRCSQLPGSSPCQAQPRTAASHQLLASLPLPQDPPADSTRLKPGRLELEGDTESARMEDSLPSSRQAPVHSPAQHSRHSSKSPNKKPTTSHFSIHVDSRAHIHRYSAAPQARSDNAAADAPTSPQVYPGGRCAWRCAPSACSVTDTTIRILTLRRPCRTDSWRIGAALITNS